MKDDDLNDRLARLRVEQDGPRQGGGEQPEQTAMRASRRLRRGDVPLASGVLIVGVIIAALSVLVISLASRGGEKQPASAIGVRRTPTAVRQASPSATRPAPETPLPATAQPAVRQDCDAIQGTSYQSEAERVYFQQNCVEPEQSNNPAPQANPPQPPSQPTSVPPAVQPTAAPPAATPVPGGSDASNAIGVAVDWITHNGSPSYTTDAGSCSAVQTGGHWVVTCNARVAGCQGSVCDAIVSVCVLSDLSAVRPSDQC
jgi:hypothetical protein